MNKGENLTVGIRKCGQYYCLSEKRYNKPVSKRGLVYEAGYALSCKRRID